MENTRRAILSLFLLENYLGYVVGLPMVTDCICGHTTLLAYSK